MNRPALPLRVPVRSRTLQPATETNVYIVEHEGVCGIVDAGSDAQGIRQVEAALSSLGGPRVQWIALTHRHRDHCGALAALRALPAARDAVVVAHRLDADDIESATGARVDRRLSGGETLPLSGLGVLALHAPGHSPGHLHLYIKELRALLSGDNVVGAGTTWVGPPDGHMATYLASLRGIVALNPAWIGPGHGPPIEDPVPRVQALIRHREEREAQVLGLIRERPQTAAEIARAIYADQVPASVMGVAERTVEGHLIKLREDYRAERDPEGRWHPR